MNYIDLNCDMGESFGVYKLGYDEAAMPLIASANIACGFHASDPENMVKTVRLAKQYGAAVGAHPSYPDLAGFGRRFMAASPEEVYADVLYQIGALWAVCRSEGMTLQHVKPHGALYNAASENVAIGIAIAEAIKAIDPKIYMVCLGNSVMTDAARQVGVAYVEEAFADRAYTNDGHLVSRKLPGSVIHDPETVAERVLSMVKDKTVLSIDNKPVPIKADTICVHGDTPGAVDMIKTIRRRFEQEGICVRPFGSCNS